MWLNMPPIWRSIAPPPSPPLNLQLDQAGNHNEDGPPFRCSIYCLLQAHDIAGCVTPAPAPVLNSVQFCDLAAADNESRFKILLYLFTYAYVQLYMFSVKVEKFLCLCRNEMFCLLLYEAMFTGYEWTVKCVIILSKCFIVLGSWWILIRAVIAVTIRLGCC